ncbi:hypothetical protein CPB84DRAFT_1151392 [Gymnopilus junonius]|uniref:Uncharacterized protein n=1 Tax=Gymnopilus junonius TaxID=109634 RepID=A0A9P5NLJ3_GYMJU|nr:hypothetical protein CPB84DRAFT_1151392 [Gymnopilus junonius]
MIWKDQVVSRNSSFSDQALLAQLPQTKRRPDRPLNIIWRVLFISYVVLDPQVMSWDTRLRSMIQRIEGQYSTVSLLQGRGTGRKGVSSTEPASPLIRLAAEIRKLTLRHFINDIVYTYESHVFQAFSALSESIRTRAAGKKCRPTVWNPYYLQKVLWAVKFVVNSP